MAGVLKNVAQPLIYREIDQPDIAGVLPGGCLQHTKGETCHLNILPVGLKLTNPYGEVVFDSSEVESFRPSL